ncbi:MAG: 1-acyl-sn-glycerol-3-phosphate acyltransferase [Succinivibrio sp.]|nr:1-acyl-sn-glycerol-3-phosphate acyltransferase [Succinivibrio sp.]
MLSFLPAPILFIINIILIPGNSIILSLPIMLLGILRFLIPVHAVTALIEQTNLLLYRYWVFNNTLIMHLTNPLKWHISGDPIPEVKNSCVVISNHLSWADILILSTIYRGHIPTTKFFMKHSLIYIPLVGLACYALGMPFLRRYPKEKLLKNPELRLKDIETTKAACRRLAFAPTSLINFVEGTRYTPDKAKLARSPYKHLMPPKVASLAIALSQIGKEIDVILNTTLYYPNNQYPHKPFIDLMCGRLSDIYADIQIIKPSAETQGDYLEDKVYKHDFTLYMRKLWTEKDELIEKLHQTTEKK